MRKLLVHAYLDLARLRHRVSDYHSADGNIHVYQIIGLRLSKPLVSTDYPKIIVRPQIVACMSQNQRNFN